MLPDYGRYYGNVFTQIIDRLERPVSIEKLSNGFQGFYLIDGKTPLFIKFCRSRKSPWSFNFQRDHQLEYKRVVDMYGLCLMVLVCGKDGIAALNNDQVREVLDGDFEAQEGLTVRRRMNKMYSIGGTNGQLGGKVARDSLFVHLANLSDEPR